MKSLTLVFIISALALALTQVTNFPELKVAISQEAVRTLKQYIVEPFVQTKLQNVSVTEEVIYKSGPVTFRTANILAKSLSIDWDNSPFLVVDANNNPSLVVRNVSVNVSFDAGIQIYGFNYSGVDNNVYLKDMNIDIDFGYKNFPNQTSYMYIANASVTIGDLDVHMTKAVAEALVKIGDLFHYKIAQIFGTLVTNGILEMNDTVIAKTLAGYQLDLMSLFNITFNVADLHFVSDAVSDAYNQIGINLLLTNDANNSTAPTNPVDNIPDFIANSYPLELLVTDNAIQQVVWAVFQSGLVNIVFTTANVPASIPLQLNSSAISILLPSIPQKYGPNKGIYLQAQAGKKDPVVAVRDGRLILLLNVNLGFWVDLDSSNYPKQGLPACQQNPTVCVEAVELDTTAFVSLTLYEMETSNIGVELVNIEIANLDVTRGEADPETIQYVLNNLMISIISQMNVQFKDGIPIDMLKQYGVKDVAFNIGTEYIFAGIEFGSIATGLEELIYH